MKDENTPYDCYGCSIVGRKREKNEDRYLIADLQRQVTIRESNLDHDRGDHLSADTPGKLLVVADGLGGHVGGARASELVVQTVCDYVLNSMHRFLKLVDEREEEFRDELAAAIDRCQRRLAIDSRTHPELAGMATTLTMAYVVWPCMYLVHVGDCRCYLMRNGELRQLTTDHTVAQQFVDVGVLKDTERTQSRWRNVIWNCLGGKNTNVAPEVLRIDLRAGDLVMLSSDGLSDQLSLLEIQQILSGKLTAEELTGQLIDVANQRGGDDNITVIVSKFSDQQQPTSGNDDCCQTTMDPNNDTRCEI